MTINLFSKKNLSKFSRSDDALIDSFNKILTEKIINARNSSRGWNTAMKASSLFFELTL